VDPTTDEVKAIDPLIRGFHVVSGPNLIVADPVRPRIYLVATVDGTPKFLVFSTGLRPGVTSSTTLPSQTVTGGGRLAITPKGGKVFVPAVNSILVMSSVSKGLVNTISLASQPNAFVVADNGLKLFVALPDKNEVAIVDTATYHVKLLRAGHCAFSKQCRPRDAGVSPDTSLVVFTGSNGSGFVMDARSESVVGQLPVKAQDVLGVDPVRNSVWVGERGFGGSAQYEISWQPPFQVIGSFGLRRPKSVSDAAFTPSGQGLAVVPVSGSAGEKAVLIPSPFSSDPSRFIHTGLPIDLIVYAL